MNDLPTVLPCPRADVDAVVRRKDCLLIVLHHDHGVAEIPKALKRRDQTAIVTLMKANRRLVKNVEHTDETTSDLARQPDALGFSARKGASTSRQRQIVQPNVEQEAHPFEDLLGHAIGNQVFALGDLHGLEELHGIGNRESTHLSDASPIDGDSQAGWLQPSPSARPTRHFAHVLLDLLSAPVGV